MHVFHRSELRVASLHQTDAAPAAQLRKLLGGDLYSAALPEGIVSAKRATGMRASPTQCT